jgi:hypothetical protein
MKRPILAAVAIATVVLLAFPALADDTFVVMMGQGNLMKSPTSYTGTFLSGFTGTWEIRVNDTFWPSASDTTARFTYIWETFFADGYDATPGSEAWYGTIGDEQLQPPYFGFDLTSPAGSVVGTATLTVMIRDMVPDGVLSQAEKHGASNVTATLVVDPNQGADEYSNQCGEGALGSGNFNFVNPPADDMIMINGLVQMFICPSPVEDSTWGTIKALYQ